MIKEDFYNNGHSKVFKIQVGKGFLDVQRKLYKITKDYLVDHDDNISLNQKLSLKFKDIPSDKFWSNLMNEMNNSFELNSLINSNEIFEAFKLIFKNPRKFEICTFRARLPNQKRVVYDWHQDEGTWFLSKKKLNNKLSATLWYSINGADEKNSIEILSKSHTDKLYDHKFINGQGYFSANTKKVLKKEIFKISTNPSEGVLFHPLALHRSVNPSKTVNMKPRYSIDIRFFENDVKLKYKTSLIFKFKKFLKN